MITIGSYPDGMTVDETKEFPHEYQSARGCVFCNYQIFQSDKETEVKRYVSDNSIIIADSTYTGVYSYVKKDGTVGIYGAGDDETSTYYPKFCPNCGKRVNEHLEKNKEKKHEPE